MRVVADTNVLISGLLWEGNESRLMKKIRVGEVTNLISPDMILELVDVLSRDKFRLLEEEVDSAITEVITISRIVDPRTSIKVIETDPGDNRILECAVQGKADYIISGDKHLLSLGKYKGIRVLSTRAFMLQRNRKGK